MTMREKQILARAIQIQKEIWRNRAICRDNWAIIVLKSSKTQSNVWRLFQIEAFYHWKGNPSISRCTECMRNNKSKHCPLFIGGLIDSLSYSAIQEAISGAIGNNCFILIYRDTTTGAAAYLPNFHNRRENLFHDLCIRYVQRPIIEIRGHFVRRNIFLQISNIWMAENYSEFFTVSLLPRFGSQLSRIVFYKPSWYVKCTMDNEPQYLFRYLS